MVERLEEIADADDVIPFLPMNDDFKSNGRADRLPTSRQKSPLLFLLLPIMMLAAFSHTPTRSYLARLTKCGGTTSSQIRKMSSPPSQLPSHFDLPSGDRIPAVGLGTWKSKPGEVGAAVKKALQVGYRHIDGAWIYGNEKEVGKAIAESNVPREQLWLTSKLWNTFHHPEDVEPALDETLSRLGTDYLDLYLMHWPIAWEKKGNKVLNRELTENPFPTWQVLEQLVSKGKLRNIGISNFNIRRIENLTNNAEIKIRPSINQVELNLWNPQPDLVKWAKEHSILLQAYSPLGGSDTVKKSLDHPTVKDAAKQLGITPAQVLTSWAIQRGTVVLPKSVHAERVEENYHVITLPPHIFHAIEDASTSHPPERTVNPSKSWGLDFDIFE